MATYNGAPWVEQQLESIHGQRDVALSLIVRDDASSDDTSLVVQGALRRFDSALFLQATRPGGSAAANFFALIDLVDVATHDFVAFADQDDIWHPDKLARATERLRADVASGYSSTVTAFWPDGRVAALSQVSTVRDADYVFEGGGQGCSFVVTAELFTRFQRALGAYRTAFDNLHYHDWALYAFSRASANRWYFDDWPCLRYRQHASNDTGARSDASGRSKRLTLIRSGWYGQQAHAIARMCLLTSGSAAIGAAEFVRCVGIKSSVSRRLQLLLFVVRHGRRRLSDRVVLACAALLGHLG